MTDQYPSPAPSAVAVDEDLAFTWKQKFEQKALTADDFRSHWAKTVPFIYHPNASNQNEEEVLFAPMEQFIAGSKDISQVFENLKKLNDTPSLCGKVFKSGEPTYSCRECGLDPTCVLCVDCFTNRYVAFHFSSFGTAQTACFWSFSIPFPLLAKINCNSHPNYIRKLTTFSFFSTNCLAVPISMM